MPYATGFKKFNKFLKFSYLTDVNNTTFKLVKYRYRNKMLTMSIFFSLQLTQIFHPQILFLLQAHLALNSIFLLQSLIQSSALFFLV